MAQKVTVKVSYEIVEQHKPLGLWLSRKPALPIRISYDGKHLDTLALVDSGADICCAPRDMSEIFGINLDPDQADKTIGTAGPVDTWYVSCEVWVLGHLFECSMAIVDNSDIDYILGRDPFFKIFQIGLRESKEEIYLSPEPNM